ncbi:MAG: Bax inhibitor-1/YccA family protein, partial [Candidatus Binatia bacterium]
MTQHLTLRSGNPALTANTFRGERAMAGAEVMTVSGTVNKTALALLLLFITASFVWNQATAGAPVGLWIGVGVIGGLITALITVFKRTWAPITTPAYAALEGLALGGISAMFEANYP